MINKGCCKREVNPSPHSPAVPFFLFPIIKIQIYCHICLM